MKHFCFHIAASTLDSNKMGIVEKEDRNCISKAKKFHGSLLIITLRCDENKKYVWGKSIFGFFIFSRY